MPFHGVSLSVRTYIQYVKQQAIDCRCYSYSFVLNIYLFGPGFGNTIMHVNLYHFVESQKGAHDHNHDYDDLYLPNFHLLEG
jgi:hypothetical protein